MTLETLDTTSIFGIALQEAQIIISFIHLFQWKKLNQDFFVLKIADIYSFY